MGGAAMDVKALNAYLADATPELGAVQDVRRFDTGQSNPTWRLDCANGPVVLRAKPAGPTLKSAHAVDREFRVMQALAPMPVPVPRVLHLYEGEAGPLGRSFYLMEHLEGRIYWDPALPDEPPVRRSAIYAEMNRVLAALHDVDPAAVGLGDYGKAGDYFRRQHGRWWRQYQLSIDTPSRAMQAMAAWLELHLPISDEARLVHGDFRLDNMIFAPAGTGETPRIIGLLDWELSTLGHPLADLAYQCMQLRLPNGGHMPGLGGLDRAALGLPTEAAYVAQYCARRGIKVPAQWEVFVVFSIFRLVAILQGVVHRAGTGAGSNPESGRKLAGAIPQLEALAQAGMETMEARSDGKE